jgi:RNA polymerase sigma-70 factor, ECF subfamily
VSDPTIPVRQDDGSTHRPGLSAARSDVLARLGRGEEAAAAYREALALTTNAVERRYLAHRLVDRGDP